MIIQLGPFPVFPFFCRRLVTAAPLVNNEIGLLTKSTVAKGGGRCPL